MKSVNDFMKNVNDSFAQMDSLFHVAFYAIPLMPIDAKKVYHRRDALYLLVCPLSPG
jgi:hypothetical protein